MNLSIRWNKEDTRLLLALFLGWCLGAAMMGTVAITFVLIREPVSSVETIEATPATVYTYALPPAEATSPPSFLPKVACGDQTRTLAFLGIDERDSNYRLFRTDAILLVKVRTEGLSTRVAILGLPRDLMVNLPDGHWDRLNTAFFWAENHGTDGWEDFQETIWNNLSLSSEAYVLVNFADFVAGVDALGGVDLTVPEAIDDPEYPGGAFSLEAGWQHLDGATALKYARTRKADTDLKRVERQVLLAQAIAQQGYQHPEAWQTLAQTVQTNLAPADLAWLLCAYRNFEGAPDTFTLTSREAHVYYLDNVGWVRQRTDRLEELLAQFRDW